MVISFQSYAGQAKKTTPPPRGRLKVNANKLDRKIPDVELIQIDAVRAKGDAGFARMQCCRF
jgi:hypothetical protein